MSVMKFDKTPTPLEEVEKINEIIDNLGSGGESFVDSGYITNCLIDVPQDINLELNSNNTITIKAGTKCYIPNGFEQDGVTKKFDEYVYASDYVCQCPTAANSYFLMPTTQSLNERHSAIQHTYAGGIQPTITHQYAVWYDIMNNIIKMTNDTGATWVTAGVALPICLEKCITANIESSIEQVFNGFGYIGNILYALPGVTGLLPNGRNEDGTLNNIKYTINSVRLREFSRDISGSGQYLALYSYGEILGSSATNRPFYQQEETPPAATNSYWYKPSENATYATFESETSWTKVPFVIIGKIVGDATGKISSLTTKTTVKLIDENELHNAEAVVETYGNGSNWYRIWSDGWCEQGGISIGVADIQLLKQFSNTDYGVVVTRRAQSENIPFVKNITVSGFTIGWKVEGQPLDVNFVNCTWKAFGYIS